MLSFEHGYGVVIIGHSFFRCSSYAVCISYCLFVQKKLIMVYNARKQVHKTQRDKTNLPELSYAHGVDVELDLEELADVLILATRVIVDRLRVVA